MSLPLSPQERTLLSEFRAALRREYREGCRNSQNLAHLVGVFRTGLRSLPQGDATPHLRALGRSLDVEAYLKLDLVSRRQLLTEVGRQVGHLLGDVPGPTNRSPLPCAPRLTTGGLLGSEIELMTPIAYLKGVGPYRGKLFEKLGVTQVGDLVTYLPRRWEDRTRIVTAQTAVEGEMAVLIGTLGRLIVRQPRPNMHVVVCPLQTSDGVVELVWFNQKWILSDLHLGAKVAVFGKIEFRNYRLQLNSPELEPWDAAFPLAGRWVPIYPATARLSQKMIRSLMMKVVPEMALKVTDPLPHSIRTLRSLSKRGPALLEYHFPTEPGTLAEARRRLAYEELYFLQVELALQRRTRELEPRQTVYRPERLHLDDFFSLLPFQPTGAQVRVAGEIVADLGLPTPMNRLLQGDVGSGKTALAAFAAWAAIRQGYQAAIMAPTEILAEQHFQKLGPLLAPAGIRLGFISGSLKKKAKLQVKEAIAAHEVDLVVGTHALLQPDVAFAKLSLVVVDEQHKFGVLQRTVLRQKGYKNNPDLLVMTATPIPRTLALTVHGELEVSKLDELPPGRTPIRSESLPFSKRAQVYAEIRSEVSKGRQAYIICPLIEESEKVEATSAVEEYKTLAEDVFPDLSLGLVHGRMKAKDKEAVMEAFRQGRHEILVSTTVIEVGVDVPNATMMVVQDANRFGLSQLHQLRGRVGRGAHESRCVFLADAKSAEGLRRLQAIAKLSDGFDVAEEDLQIRGPGDYFGLRQSGFPEFQVADLTRDGVLLEEARHDAVETVAQDPDLKNEPLLRALLQLRAETTAELVH